MKKILALVVIFAFLIMPSVSLAKCTSISDSDLDGIVAQAGSITITFDNITLKNTTLKTSSIDFADFWNPNWIDGKCVAGKMCHADYFGQDNPDYENNYNPTDLSTKGYFGYADVYQTGGLVERSGSVTLDVATASKLTTDVNSLTIRANIGVEASIKLSTTNANFASSSQTLGIIYTAGITSTTNGSMTVYARNN
jgi:hypothetical protein